MRTATTATERRMDAHYPGTCRGHVSVGDVIWWSKATGARHDVCPEQSTEPQAQTPQRMAVEDSGVYVLPGGAIVKVKSNQSRTSTYTLRWTEIGGTRLTEAGTKVNGEYVYEPALMGEVVELGRKMTLDEAKAFILRYGNCCRCGRHLKSADSVERGIGPVCVGYFAPGATGAADLAA